MNALGLETTIQATQLADTELALADVPRGTPLPCAIPTAPGSTFQHYEIIRALGRGGMGEVHLARDTRLGRLVALKLLHHHGGAEARRFLDEARVTAQVGHENIVVIHELGEHEGTPYMVLEYLEGRTLQQWMDARRERGGISGSRAAELLLPVVRALVVAHERGVIHRDLKPSNIMLTDTGTTKVLDFGIAKRIGAPVDPEAASSTPAHSMALTQDGALLGTLPYMSPEQWGVDGIDHRTDLWAVGVILAELCLGQHPLAPLSVRGLSVVPRIDVPMPSVRALRPDLGKMGSIIDRCLLKRKEDRLGSASELAQELAALVPRAGRAGADEEQNPYPGLVAFREDDAARFFGRTRAITEVVQRLSERPLLAIVGPSGAGKSSFVRAGIIPALQRTGDAWEAFSIRPGARPLAALAELLLAHAWHTSSQDVRTHVAEAPVAPLDRDTLIDKLRAEPGFLGAQMRARARRRLSRALLFVDQLEELYTLAPEPERAAFFACLSGVADDVGSPLRVILAIRSDFLDRVAEAHAARTGLGRGLLLLARMDREGLREALERPLAAVEYRFEHGALVEEMVSTLEHTAGALPLLQFTAAKLWDYRDRERRMLTEESYRRVGGIEGTLATHADAVLGAMSLAERKLARAMLLRLVTPEHTRALCTLGELQSLASTLNEAESVLERLIDARLLTVEGGDGAEATVELVHESLITRWPTLSQWIQDSREDAAFLSRLRHAAREWQAHGEVEDSLWRGRAADEAARWSATHPGELSGIEERYLNAVLTFAERARRRRRGLLVSAFLSLALVAASMSYLAWEARRNAQIAKLNEDMAHEAADMAGQAADEARAEAERGQAEVARACDILRRLGASEAQMRADHVRCQPRAPAAP